LLRKVVDEALHQRRLAHARGAADVHGHTVAPARGLERSAKGREMLLATDEGDVGSRCGTERRRGSTGPAEARQDVGAQGAKRGVAIEQCAAQLVQIDRHVRAQARWWGGIEQVLALKDVGQRAYEGRTPDEGLVEHDPDAVPVACRAVRLAEGLLGCHIGRCADELGHLALVEGHGPIRGHPEVEQDDAAFRSDEDVRWLDVPVKFPSLVKGVEALGEAQQCAPQSRHVCGRLRRLADAEATGAQRRRARRGDSSLRPHLGPEHIRVEVGAGHELH
jgi:hypothetical protein